jgi:hypothetical protein
VWQGKDGVKVGHREAVGLVVGHPLRCGEALALGTVPMATGVVGVALEAALRALLHVCPPSCAVRQAAMASRTRCWPGETGWVCR